MKPFYTFLLIILISNNVFAKDYPVVGFYNHNSNANSLGHVLSLNVPGNIGDSVTLIAYFYQSGGQLTGPWFFNGNPYTSNGVSSVSFTISSYGIFTSQIYICLATLTIVQASPTSIKLNDPIAYCNLYPSLVSTIVNLEIELIKNENIEIIIYATDGRIVKTSFYKNVFGELKLEEDFTNFAKGTYLITVNTGKSSLKKKIVKI